MAKDYSTYFRRPSMRDAIKRTGENVPIVREGIEIPPLMAHVGVGKKYRIETYGCQANERDGEVMAGIFEMLGFTFADTIQEADVILLNTCAVRENAEERVFGEIGHLKSLKQKNPDLIFGVCGCMTQQESTVAKILEKTPHIDLIFGTHNIHRLPVLLQDALFNKERVVEVFSKEGEVYENLPSVRHDHLKAWVNVMYGCDKFCTYCIVPYTRGKERSRLKDDIMQEVNDLVKQGFIEVTLLGQNVNAYGKDLHQGYDFADLLEAVARTGIPRIRFMTSHPWDFTDRMIDVLATYPNLMPHVHLPLQSGDSTILRRMGRRYTKDQYVALYHKLRKSIPGVSITTDIIVGFPGETLEQFEGTMEVVRECRYDSAFTFIYSPRQGTPATRMVDNVEESTKKERFNRLIAQVAIDARFRNDAYVGKVLKVLVEGTSKKNDQVLSGYAENSKLVNFTGSPELIGLIVEVEITKAKAWTLEGKVVNHE